VADPVRKDEVKNIYRTLLKGREVWMDPEDALEMATDLFDAGFRKVAQ